METIAWDLDAGLHDPHSLFAFRTAVVGNNAVHVQPFHEFAFFERGGGWQLHGSKRYRARAGDLFFLPADDWHIAESDARATLIVVNFYTAAFAASIPADAEARAVVRALQERAHAGQPLVPLPAPSRPRVRALCDQMVAECAHPRPGSLSAVKILLQSLLLVLQRETPLGRQMRFPADSVLPAGHAGRIETVLAHIREHLSEPLFAEQLAHLAGLNRSSFHTAFHELTGHTPVSYINRLRIHRAAELLAQTDLALTVIGERCGFPCRSHFHSVFKLLTGHTPRDYRQRHRASPTP